MAVYQSPVTNSVIVVIGEGDIAMRGGALADKPGHSVIHFQRCEKAEGIRTGEDCPEGEWPPAVSIAFANLEVLEAFAVRTAAMVESVKRAIQATAVPAAEQQPHGA